MDNKNKNLENFFRSKLDDYPPNQEGWNTPPEFIWENSKKSFPSRKKKRKFPFLWLLFGGVVLLSGIGMMLLFKNTMPDKVPTIATTTIKSNNPNPSLSQMAVTSNNKGHKATNKATNKVTNKATNKVTNKVSNKVSSKISNSKQTSSTNKKSRSKNIAYNKSIKTNSNHLSSKKSLINTNFLTKTPTHRNLKFSQQSRFVEGGVVNATRKEYSDINTTYSLPVSTVVIPKLFINNNVGKRSLVAQRSSLSPFQMLSKRDSKLTISEHKFVIKNQLKPYDVVKRSKKWEVGFSTSRYFYPKQLLVEIETNDGEEWNLQIVGVNSHIRRWLNPKWSLSSGIYYSKVAVDARISKTIPFFNYNFNLNLRNAFEGVRVGNVNFNDDSEVLKLVYKSGLGIPERTPVDFQLDFSIDVRSIEIPIELNHHWRAKRWEFVLGGGIMLNFINFSINPLALKIYHNEQLLNKPIYTNKISESEISWNFTSNIGVRYHLTNRINIQSFVYLDPFEFKIARFGFGVNYRF